MTANKHGFEPKTEFKHSIRSGHEGPRHGRRTHERSLIPPGSGFFHFALR